MGFGLPLALAGLLAVAGPILAHLVRRRDLRRRTLPTIALLAKANAQSKRRVRVADRLLLFLRVAAVAAMALGIAEPFVRTQSAFGDGQRATLVIVLDDSMSMARGEGDDTLLADAARDAADAIRGLPEGSEVAVVLAGRPARTFVARTEDRESAARELLALGAHSARGTDLPGAIALARRALAGAKHRRRLWVLSDFAAHSRAEDLRWPRGPVEVALERRGPEDQADPNVAILAAHAAPDPTTPGHTSLRVRLLGQPRGELRVLSGGDILASAPATPDEAGVVTLHLATPEGNPPAQVELDTDDALREDDVRGVLLRPPAAVRVLLVDGDPHAARTRDEVGYLVRALDASPRDDGGIRYRTLDADALSPAALRDADVIVLANVPAPTAVVARRIVELVREGVGLWITGGDRVDARAYRARFGEILPVELGPPRDLEASVEGSGEGWPSVGLRATRVTRMLRIEPSMHGEVLARAGESPAMVAGDAGAGRVVVWASSVDDDWTDLPFQPGFVALATSLLRSLGARAAPPQAIIEAGARVPLDAYSGDEVYVRDPRGERFEVSPPEPFAATVRAGAYGVLVGDDVTPRASFVVAPPREESDLTPAPLPSLPEEGEATSVGLTSRVPIDHWLFALAALFLFAEGVVRTRRRAAV